MEASSTYHSRKHEGDVARLVSRVVQVPRVCFTFYYHMYGRDMGSLRVNLRFKNGTEVNRWNITGNQGDRWQSARISVENPEDFQVSVYIVCCGLSLAPEVRLVLIRCYHLLFCFCLVRIL